MSDLEILFWVVQACVALWCAYQLGYHFGRVRGIESSMSFIDSELKRLKKILEDKIDATEHTTK